jgi:adenylate kinase
LIQRKDDQPQIVQERLDSFYAQTAPVISFYERRGQVAAIDAQLPVDTVYATVCEALGPKA